jgi:hypothetical protein
MRTRGLTTVLALVVAVAALVVFHAPAAHAAGVSGALFTTTADGTEVNANQYASKEDVYLDGGPGINAPAGAAGLPDGTYVFQVTDPSGKVLLSTDPAGCRQVTVSGGVFTGVVAFGSPDCSHLTGDNIFTQAGSKTVQLMPYNDTPNNGGVYKAWVTPLGDYQCDLTVVDCGYVAGQNVHGFAPDNSKTDNYKVKQEPIREIDTKFFDATGQQIEGVSEVWTDTLGAHNTKWVDSGRYLSFYRLAHVEGVEQGVHQISFYNQPGCTIGEVDTAFPGQPTQATGTLGPQTVSVNIPKSGGQAAITWYLLVHCA